MAKSIASFCLLIVFFWQPVTLTARNLSPLEILYVQTDKQNYFTGENIWFRTYLVNSHTHVQDTTSHYVYAELINSLGKVENRVKIRYENSVFAGHIPVTEELEAGSYILRFFTRHLENFGEEYFFQRVIHIITSESLEENYLSEQPLFEEDYLSEQLVPEPVQNDSFVVSFHPEGGDIPVGVSTRVAFKAINSFGLGEDIQGVIVNERGDTITHIESAHRGMGSFRLTADGNERFFAIAQNAAGVEKRFELPRAGEDAISLQILRQRENIVVHLPKTDNKVLYLTLQHRGQVIYSEKWNNNSDRLIIPEVNLLTGVIGVVLSDERGAPISKRQIFNTNRLEKVNTTFTTDRNTHGARERVNAIVSITDSENRPLRANFSISVIDNDIAQYDTSINILSTLLLTSELRGHIEDPAYYFMRENENAETYLDLVMLTHGWSRFDVSKIYQEETLAVWQDFETSQTITGILEGGQRRIANRSVTLLIPKFVFFDTITTDSEGRFRFEDFEFPDGTDFYIQGNRDTEIYIDEEAFPAVNNFFIPTETNNVLVFDNEQKEEFRKFIPNDGIWSEVLDEFVVTAERLKIDPRRPVFSSPFNRVIEREELERWNAPTLLQLLQLVVPGVGVFYPPGGGSPILTIRRRGLVSEPLILVNNAYLPHNLLHTIPVHIVESIEIEDDPSILPLNVNSALYITTGFPPPSEIYSHITVITPLGYQVTKEFFSPAYTTPEQRANERPDLRTTLFWNPNVTTGENGEVDIHFYTSDYVGNYVVIIEGVTDDGGIVRSVSRLR
jgi:hypothetical protein